MTIINNVKTLRLNCFRVFLFIFVPMKINYLDCNGLKKLFSFYRHDYVAWTSEDEKFFMFDGGSTLDPESYGRYSGGEIKQGEVKDLIGEVREVFTWGQNYDKDNNRLEKTKYALLKDLTSSHICGILSYFNNGAYNAVEKDPDVSTTKSWHITQSIFIEELNYRINNNLI